MPIPKGKTNNPNGRPAGTPNKSTGAMRDRINSFLDDNFEQLQKDFSQVNPKERLDFYIKLLQYGVPSLKAIDHSVNISNKLESMNESQLNELIEQILNKEEYEPEP